MTPQFAPPQSFGHNLVRMHGQGIAVLMLTCAIVELELGGLSSRHVIELERRATGYRRAVTFWHISAGRQQSDRPCHRRTNIVKSFEQVRLAASVRPVHRSYRKEILPVRALYEERSNSLIDVACMESSVSSR